MIFRFIQTLLTEFADLLFPSLCLGCSEAMGENESILCTSCRIKLPETKQHLNPDDEHLLNKFAGKVPIRFVASYVYFNKGGIAQKLIHNIKYKGQKEAAKQIAEWYGHQLRAECNRLKEIELVLGVPLHKSRMQQRGYNQADWIAEGIADVFIIPARTDILVRNEFNSSQTNKNRLERWENVKTVFAVVKPEAVINKNILLVDDVLTTGATLEACAIELFKAGCNSVSVLTLAVAGR